MEIAVGDKIRVVGGLRSPFFQSGHEGLVVSLGVKYPGDVRVKFPHDKELIWVYSDEYERVASGEEIQSR